MRRRRTLIAATQPSIEDVLLGAIPGLPTVHLHNPVLAFEVPNTSGVNFHDMFTVSLGGTGTIAHIINGTGGPSNSGNSVADLVNYP